MVARSPRERDAVVVQFDRDDEEPKQQCASDGREALLLAVGMLINRRQLRVHDRLSVRAADEAND